MTWSISGSGKGNEVIDQVEGLAAPHDQKEAKTFERARRSAVQFIVDVGEGVGGTHELSCTVSASGSDKIGSITVGIARG